MYNIPKILSNVIFVTTNTGESNFCQNKFLLILQANIAL